MALSNEIVSVRYAGNNSAVTAYPVPFRFVLADHVKVAVLDAAGAETILASGYTVTGAGDPTGGSLTTAVAIPSSSTVTIYRDMAAVQPYSYEEGQRLHMKTVEGNFDYLSLIQQEQRAALPSGQRAIGFPVSEDPENAATLPTADVRKDSFVYFNALTGQMETMSRATLAASIAPGGINPSSLAFSIDESGNLILEYPDGTTPPEFSIDGSGNLILTT